jgi:hypothetical protein
MPALRAERAGETPAVPAGRSGHLAEQMRLWGEVIHENNVKGRDLAQAAATGPAATLELTARIV